MKLVIFVKLGVMKLARSLANSEGPRDIHF